MPCCQKQKPGLDVADPLDVPLVYPTGLSDDRALPRLRAGLKHLRVGDGARIPQEAVSTRLLTGAVDDRRAGAGA